ncbi:MAG: YitT family protein [Bacillus subtilis]|nr:YitT family protein [Bacillus subtilis]
MNVVEAATGGAVKINLGILIYGFQIPLMVFGWFKLSRRFIVYTIISVTLIAFFLALPIGYAVMGTDTLGSALAGGGLLGIGNGILLRVGGQLRGHDDPVPVSLAQDGQVGRPLPDRLQRRDHPHRRVPLRPADRGLHDRQPDDELGRHRQDPHRLQLHEAGDRHRRPRRRLGGTRQAAAARRHRRRRDRALLAPVQENAVHDHFRARDERIREPDPGDRSEGLHRHDGGRRRAWKLQEEVHQTAQKS